MNWTLVEAGRAIMIQGSKIAYLWDEALVTAAYIRNRAINSTIGKTPFETWFNKTLDVNHYRIPNKLQKKLDFKSNPY